VFSLGCLALSLMLLRDPRVMEEKQELWAEDTDPSKHDALRCV
jgi:hypothetical protein